jgi:hypothetical protein
LESPKSSQSTFFPVRDLIVPAKAKVGEPFTIAAKFVGAGCVSGINLSPLGANISSCYSLDRFIEGSALSWVVYSYSETQPDIDCNAEGLVYACYVPEKPGKLTFRLLQPLGQSDPEGVIISKDIEVEP